MEKVISCNFNFKDCWCLMQNACVKSKGLNKHLLNLCLETYKFSFLCKNATIKPFAFEGLLIVTQQIRNSDFNAGGFCFSIN